MNLTGQMHSHLGMTAAAQSTWTDAFTAFQQMLAKPRWRGKVTLQHVSCRRGENRWQEMKGELLERKQMK